MRRLHGNLAYLAAMADRRGSVNVPPCPAYLMPPPLNLTIAMKGQNPVSEAHEKQPDPNVDREERDKIIRNLYAKLQALFPGIDPKKEPTYTVPGAGSGSLGQGGLGQNAQRPAGGASRSTQASPAMGHQKAPQMAAQPQAITS